MLFVFLACTTAAVTTDPEVEQLQEQVNALQEQVNALQDQLGVSSGDTEQPDTTTADRLTALEAQAEAEAEQLEALGDAVSVLQGTQPRIWTRQILDPEGGATETPEVVTALDLDLEEEGTVWIEVMGYGTVDLSGGVSPDPQLYVSVDDATSYGRALDGVSYDVYRISNSFVVQSPISQLNITAQEIDLFELNLLVIFTPGV